MRVFSFSNRASNQTCFLWDRIGGGDESLVQTVSGGGRLSSCYWLQVVSDQWVSGKGFSGSSFSIRSTRFMDQWVSGRVGSMGFTGNCSLDLFFDPFLMDESQGCYAQVSSFPTRK